MDFERLELPDSLGRLRSLASCMCDNMITEIEEYSSKLKTLTAEAVLAARMGQRVEVKLTFTPTVPDLTECIEEFRRVVELHELGAIE